MRHRGSWTGVLLTGPSGAGKSTLASSVCARGWRLVADDRTLAWRSGGRLFGRAPAPLAGLVEARGTGVLACPARRFVALSMAVELAAGGDRVPEPAALELLDVRLPLFRLDPRSPAAAQTCALLVAGLTPWTGAGAGVWSPGAPPSLPPRDPS